MTLPLLSRKPVAFQRTLLALALAAASASASALPAFDWDPSAAGLDGNAFTADNLLVSNYSTVTFSGASFTQTGYLAVSAAQLGGLTLPSDGLNSTYGMYIQFSGSGTLTNGGNPATTPTLGKLDTLTYTLYGYNGTSSFGFDGANNPTETASGEVALASGSLVLGTVTTTPLGDGTFNPAANAKLTLNWLVDGFQTSSPIYNMALTSFSNTTSQVEAFNGGFRIRQGGGSVNFAAAVVPEPSTYAMLLAGLGAIGFVARRRTRSDK